MINGLTVMVIDDQRSMRSILRQLLTRAGVENVIEAGDGAAAMELLTKTHSKNKSESPDVILCDLHMEGMDGLQFSNEIRRSKDPRVAGIPILILTGEQGTFIHEVVEDAGVTKVLLKPISGEELGKEIEAAVGFVA